jgi:hypothetical protein
VIPASIFIWSVTPHDQQRIAGDEAVLPPERALVVIKIDRIPQGRVFLRAGEEWKLRPG